MSTQHLDEQQYDKFAAEAERLVDLQIELREQLLAGQSLVPDSGEDGAFSRASAAKQTEVLRGEAAKLEQREAVLVIVGTMKAGKSTSINAIVGTEALPTRNRPMTTLPTLIRHTPGQHRPALSFDNRAPMEQLMSDLRDRLEQKSNKWLEKRRHRDPHFDELVETVEKGVGFKPRYEGADEIAEFLRDLNDLARLAGEAGVEFPFADYDEVHEMPVIEVEFAHVVGGAAGGGRLALLDTPGPNEYRQPQLRKLLRDQLAKATAVLTVLDYTQLKSDADAEIRSELDAIKDVMAGRAYALVNKFDERDSHGDDEHQVRLLVAEDLMDGVVSADDVFPASARPAYLANRAKHEMGLEGQLPDPAREPWVEDFAQEAFGKASWRSGIADAQKVIENADALWEYSRFNPLLERVIRAAHANAALLAVDSTASKLVDHADRLENYLSIRTSALDRDVADLERQASKIEESMAALAQSADEAKAHTDGLLTDLGRSIESDAKGIVEQAEKMLDEYFRTGKRVEQDKAKKSKEEEDEKRLSPYPTFLSRALDSWGFSSLTYRDDTDFDPNEPSVKFKSKSEARDMVDRITRSAVQILAVAEDELRKALEQRVDEFDSAFSSAREASTRAVLTDMRESAAKDGFTIKVPAISPPRLSVNVSSNELIGNVISTKTTRKIKRVEQGGPGGAVKRGAGWLFGQDDWGYDDVEVIKKRHYVDVQKARKQITAGLGEKFNGLGGIAAEIVKDAVDDSVTIFFAELHAKVEEIRQDFLQSKRDKELSREDREKLRTTLGRFLEDAKDAATDCAGLKQDVGTSLPTLRSDREAAAKPDR